MKILIMILIICLMGCEEQEVINETVEAEYTQDNLYIVSGQSNAERCDWSHFESITGSTVINLSVGGYSIESLIADYDKERILGTNPAGIIFVHGETDSRLGTDTGIYNAKVEQYRQLISNDVDFDLPLYISSVGYHATYPDINYDILRASVVEQAKINPLWFIAYEDVKNFRDWGMLVDYVHFTKEGCEVMMEGIAASI